LLAGTPGLPGASLLVAQLASCATRR